VDHVIALGDLNYRMASYSDWTPITVGLTLLDFQNTPEFDQEVRQQDELSRNLPRFPSLNEGVYQDGLGGPRFKPTCQLLPGRNAQQTDLRSYQLQNRTPSFCDRILYQTRPLPGAAPIPVLQGLAYEALDEGITTQSDHAAVYGLLGFTMA
jgi:hypothetical protein